MVFEEALKFVKHGKRIQRQGWNGKDMWVLLQRPESESKMTLPYLYMKTVEGNLIPWVVSHTDLLAADWITLD